MKHFLIAIFLGFLSALIFLFLTSKALAEPRPEPHPSCKCKKAKVAKTQKPYSYWSIGVITDEDGNVTIIRIRCHVDRKGRHTCSGPIG
jgi:hypothetical protein